MKKSIDIKLNNKEVSFEFTIRRLAKFEKALGNSLFYVMSSGGMLKAMDINFTVAGVACATSDEMSLDAAADLIQKHCDNGGTLDEINNAIYQAVIASGIYIKTDNGETNKGN